jgi:hypothetical protein
MTHYGVERSSIPAATNCLALWGEIDGDRVERVEEILMVSLG